MSRVWLKFNESAPWDLVFNFTRIKWTLNPKPASKPENIKRFLPAKAQGSIRPNRFHFRFPMGIIRGSIGIKL